MTVTHVLIRSEIEPGKNACSILKKVADLIKTTMEENEGAAAVVYCKYGI